jgi:alpha-galactosidase
MPKQKPLTTTFAILFVMFLSRRLAAVTPTREEMAEAGRLRQPSFSFLYDGLPSRSFLSAWKSEESRKQLDSSRAEVTRSYLDPRTGLEVRCVSIEYNDFPAVEWTVYFSNKGGSKTPVLKDIQGLDMSLPVADKGQTVLYWMRGDDNSGQSFAPQEKVFAPGGPDSIMLAPSGGRSSDGVAPFFNVAWQAGGMAVAVGWSGQWQATGVREADGTITIRAGQQATNLALAPGETVRTPRIMLVSWRGPEPVRGTNLFRQLLIRHVLPRRGGELVFPPVCASVNEVDPNGDYEGPHVRVMPALAERGYEAFWSDMDPQHWYPGGFPEGTGNWEVDRVKYPRGLEPVSDAAHKAGLEYLLWFEPERVFSGTNLDRERPGWMMKTPDGKGSRLFALHIPEARRWLTDLMDGFIEETKLDWMRWDFNIEPLDFWRRADAQDRRGMTENQYISGLYAMWDELRARHPNLVIDVCASGGRRIDLETLSRGLTLWHSDLQCEGSHPAADQLQNAGLSRWVPLHGTSALGYEPAYSFRSSLTAGNIHVCADQDGIINNARDHTAAAAKRSTAVYPRVRPFMIGDFYPLFPHLESEDVWFGYQFHRPDLEAGMALVFRREKCTGETGTAELRGIDPGSRYEVTFEDAGTMETMTGAELARLKLTVPQAPGSALVFYKMIKYAGSRPPDPGVWISAAVARINSFRQRARIPRIY